MSLAAKSMAAPNRSAETNAKFNAITSGEWQYKGPKGPSFWAKLSPKYKLCQRGKEQSPINIPQNWELQNHLQPFYQASRFSIIDNGWAVQVEVEKGQEVYLNGKPFQLKKVEFHSPSEHFLNGRGFPMEIQMIHQNRSGDLAIVGVFVEEGRPNQTVETLWRYLPKSVGNAVSPKSTLFNPRQLMPQKLEVYHYYGSLTRPPCHENIYWNILREPLELSHKQIERFREKYRFNSRPVQALNAR
jgi:carbonic anhydrase